MWFALPNMSCGTLKLRAESSQMLHSVWSVSEDPMGFCVMSIHESVEQQASGPWGVNTAGMY